MPCTCVGLQPQPDGQAPALHAPYGLDDLYRGQTVDDERQRRLLGLFRLDFANPAEMRADVAGLAAIRCFEACDRAILVDALRGFGPPGSVHDLDTAEVAEAAARDEAPAGFHGAGVGALLELLPAALDHVPPSRLVGVEIERVSAFSPGLSAIVAAAVEGACQRIREHLP